MHKRSMIMARACLALCAGTLVARPESLVAAEITDVADAADEIVIGNVKLERPWTGYLTIDTEYYQANGKITREPIARAGVSYPGCTPTSSRDCAPVDELRYVRNTAISRISAEFGLYQDFSLTVGWGMITADSLKFRYASGVDKNNSSIDPQNQVQPPPPALQTGQDINGDGVNNARDTLFPHNFETWHGGLFNQAGSLPLELGLRFAPLNDERDESKPNWVVFGKLAAPWTTKTYHPTVATTSAKPGSVGDGMYWLILGTALSKRVGEYGLIGIDPNINRRGYVDPYMELSYSWPFAAGGSPTHSALAANDPTKSGGRLPSRIARLKAGVELVPYEDLREGRKITFDLRLNTTYFSSGRNYSELTDALLTPTFTDQYVNLTSEVGLHMQLAEYFKIKFSFLTGYNTDHWLTDESAGSAYYCPATTACGTNGLPYNAVGYRLRDQEHVILGGTASIELIF